MSQGGQGRVEQGLNLETFCHSSGVTEVNREGCHAYLSNENGSLEVIS
jgi:hypothetical protein